MDLSSKIAEEGRLYTNIYCTRTDVQTLNTTNRLSFEFVNEHKEFSLQNLLLMIERSMNFELLSLNAPHLVVEATVAFC